MSTVYYHTINTLQDFVRRLNKELISNKSLPTNAVFTKIIIKFENSSSYYDDNFKKQFKLMIFSLINEENNYATMKEITINQDEFMEIDSNLLKIRIRNGKIFYSYNPCLLKDFLKKLLFKLQLEGKTSILNTEIEEIE